MWSAGLVWGRRVIRGKLKAGGRRPAGDVPTDEFLLWVWLIISKMQV